MKYKVGDRVRIVDHRTAVMADDGKMDHWLGKIMTIKHIEERRTSGVVYYKMVEDEKEFFGNGWYWDDECIAGLAEIDGDWTEDEIEKARGIVAYLADDVVYNGGDIRFFCGDKDEKHVIAVSVFTDCFDANTYKDGRAETHGKDSYNPWIGKCVALCKALDRPIPDFIMNKNRE